MCVFVGGLENGISMCAAARSPFSLFTSSMSLPPLHLSRRPAFVPEIAGRETEDAAAHPEKKSEDLTRKTATLHLFTCRDLSG